MKTHTTLLYGNSGDEKPRDVTENVPPVEQPLTEKPADLEAKGAGGGGKPHLTAHGADGGKPQAMKTLLVMAALSIVVLGATVYAQSRPPSKGPGGGGKPKPKPAFVMNVVGQ